MKRVMIFALAGPPLGFVVAFWGMLQIANWLLGDPVAYDLGQLGLLPEAYLIGLVPALLAAMFDGAMAKRNIAHRVALTSLFAYVVCYLPLGGALLMGFIGGPVLLLYGLVGAIPAAVCSWLSTGSRPLPARA